MNAVNSGFTATDVNGCRGTNTVSAVETLAYALGEDRPTGFLTSSSVRSVTLNTNPRRWDGLANA